MTSQQQRLYRKSLPPFKEKGTYLSNFIHNGKAAACTHNQETDKLSVHFVVITHKKWLTTHDLHYKEAHLTCTHT